MAWVRLACWYRGHAPDEVLEVADDAVKALSRDGRIAEVVAAPEAPEPVLEERSEPVPAEPKRRRRAEE
jgi:hypothetical protein